MLAHAHTLNDVSLKELAEFFKVSASIAPKHRRGYTVTRTFAWANASSCCWSPNAPSRSMIPSQRFMLKSSLSEIYIELQAVDLFCSLAGHDQSAADSGWPPVHNKACKTQLSDEGEEGHSFGSWRSTGVQYFCSGDLALNSIS